MSAVFCKLLRLLPASRRPRPVLARTRPQPRDTGWHCLELAGQPVAPSHLRTVRELVVRDPAALTADVLVAAPALLAVVLPARCRLPAPIAAELARRRIATVWRQPEFLTGSGQDGDPCWMALGEVDPFGPTR